MLFKIPFRYLFPLIIILLSVFSTQANARIYTQYSFGYNSDSDNVTSFSYTRMNNMLTIGASFDQKHKWVLGWNFYLWNRSYQTTTTQEVSLTELGPKVLHFFNDELNFYFSAAYHPYVKGTITGTTTEEVSGSGYIVSMGYHHKASKSVYFGASLNYQSTSLDKSTVSNVESDVSYSYTEIIPMIEMSIRFK